MGRFRTKYGWRQFFCYFAGLFTMTIGINLSKLANLGITATTAIPRVLELTTGLTLGAASLLIYLGMILVQLLLLRRRFPVRDLLGVPLTFLFGWMVDLTGTDPNAFGHLLLALPKPQGYPQQLGYMVLSVAVSGVGIFLYLRPRWIRMPSEGLAGAISTVSGLSFGNCKSLSDTSLVAIALVLQMALLGGLSSFVGEGVVVREGTVVSALLMGQIVRLLTGLVGDRVDRWLFGGAEKNSP